jgi:hypothetical protein
LKEGPSPKPPFPRTVMVWGPPRSMRIASPQSASDQAEWLAAATNGSRHSWSFLGMGSGETPFLHKKEVSPAHFSRELQSLAGSRWSLDRVPSSWFAPTVGLHPCDPQQEYSERCNPLTFRASAAVSEPADQGRVRPTLNGFMFLSRAKFPETSGGAGRGQARRNRQDAAISRLCGLWSISCF